MKKLIAILAIMIVLVGAVFAEQQNLTIKATITPVEPIFQLKVTTNAATNNTYTTNNTNGGVQFDAGTIAAQGNDSAVDTGFSLLAGGTVTAICQVHTTAANKTQSNTAYLIKFSDGDFTVTKANDTAALSSTVAPTSITTSYPETVPTGIKTNGFSFNGGTSPNQWVKVQFSGAQMAVGDQTVASAAYYYEEHTDVVPGTYYANIRVEITVTN